MLERVITRLGHLLEEIPKLIKLISEEEISKKENSKKWSKKEILGHLVDSATNNHTRFIKAQFGSQPFKIQPYDQDAWVQVNDYQQTPIADILHWWTDLNKQIVEVISAIPPKRYEHPCITHEGTTMTLEALIVDYLEHTEHHLKQILGQYAVLDYNPYEKQHVTLREALSLLPNSKEEVFASVLKHGTLEIEIFTPQGEDTQQPHSKDEVYIVIEGEGFFINGNKRHPFRAGDVIFAPAGVAHRFEDFTENFKAWVIFYGPEGGEATKS